MVGQRSILAAVASAFALAWACDPSTPQSDLDGATADDAGSEQAAFSFDASWAPPQPQPPDAIAPPLVDCSDAGDAGDAGACPLPKSFCLDSSWLEYFDNGVCVDGGCQYEVHLYSCSCFNDGCYTGGGLTAPVPP